MLAISLNCKNGCFTTCFSLFGFFITSKINILTLQIGNYTLWFISLLLFVTRIRCLYPYVVLEMFVVTGRPDIYSDVSVTRRSRTAHVFYLPFWCFESTDFSSRRYNSRFKGSRKSFWFFTPTVSRASSDTVRKTISNGEFLLHTNKLHTEYVHLIYESNITRPSRLFPAICPRFPRANDQENAYTILKN